MKVIIPRVELVSLIGKIQNVVSAKPTIPILANVLIEAIDDQLIISATDLTVSMRVYGEAKVLEEGAITVPARRFFQLIRELTAPQVEIHMLSPEVVLVNAGSSHFRLQAMHKSEFPALPDLSEGTPFSLSTSLFKEMLSRSSFAAARDDSRQVLNGVNLHCENRMAIFTGTDGKRLARIHAPVDLAFEHTGSYNIPMKGIEEMIRILDVKAEESTKVTLMSDKIAVEVKSTILISKLLSGQYPDVSRIIPAKQSDPVALHREELISLLRQVSLFTSEESSSVRFSFSSGELHLSANSGEIGEGKVNMPVNYGGDKLEVAFNPNFFLDILRHSKDETVSFNLSDPFNPGLITDSTTAQYVVMPMRLDA